MSEYECSYCPFSTDDGWAMLAHRDTHRGDPRVVAGTAKVNTILLNLDDAPLAQCSRCGRKTWSESQVGAEDRMTMPDGSPCGGRFGPERLS
jgi:hypothetical protein